MEGSSIALAMFAAMMVLLFSGQRMFGIIGFVAVIAALVLWSDRGEYTLAFAQTLKVMDWTVLMSLPMFIFMGYVMAETRLVDDLYRMFHVWFGPIPGGLAIGTVLLMTMVAAINGLSVAGMAIGCTIVLPEILKRGYDKRFVVGLIQGSSSLGILIPPSVVLVLYAQIARQPVGQLWLAGLVPGLMMAGFFMLYSIIRCSFNPALGPPLPREERMSVTWGERFRLLGAGFVPFFILGAMMVPFVTGYTRLVESSVIGALAASLLALLRGRLTFKVLENSARETLMVSCMFLWIILAALAFGAVFDGLHAADALENLFVDNLHLNPWVILILMQLSFVVMGTFLDDTAMLVIVAPLYVPLVAQLDLGVDHPLIWFGVLYTITCQIAYLTPPFGYNLFLMRAMAGNTVSMAEIFVAIIPSIAIMILTLVVLMIFPEIALWLPNMFAK